MSPPTSKPDYAGDFRLFDDGLGEDDWWDTSTTAMFDERPLAKEAPEAVWNHWIGVFRDRLKHDFDNVIAIDGPRGSGKSTLGIQIARPLDPQFTEAQILYSAEEMLRAWSTLEAGQVAIFDEAVLGLLSRKASSDENTRLVQAVMIARRLGITVILCIPDFMNLDPAFRDTAIQYRITCVLGEKGQRGTALVHVRSEKIRYDTGDPRRLYKSRRWNPIRFDGLSGDPLWARYLQLAKEKARSFASNTATELASRGRLRYSGKNLPTGTRGPKKCPHCPMVLAGSFALNRHVRNQHPWVSGVSDKPSYHVRQKGPAGREVSDKREERPHTRK